MNGNLYSMIFKRQSFHLFRNIGNEHITEDELADIENTFNTLQPLVNDIKVRMKIVKDSTSCKRGQEYCILLYSEKKDNYLGNIGYIGEQLDLYLVSKNIGTLWFGIGKTNQSQLDGLDFVIMIAIAKADSLTRFRNDISKIKRKEVSKIWNGNYYLDFANVVRLAPSAGNSQPWFVDATNSELKVYRCQKERFMGLMSGNKMPYYNKIDMGIFLCFLELCLNKDNIEYRRILYTDQNDNNGKVLTAVYTLSND